MPISITRYIQPFLSNPLGHRDNLIFSPEVKATSKIINILANLEEWLSSAPSCSQRTTYQVLINPLNTNTHSVWLTENTLPSHTTYKKNALFITLKVLATLLIIPRLVAEIIRFGLRKYLNFQLQPRLDAPKKVKHRQHIIPKKTETNKFLELHNIIQLLKETILDRKYHPEITYLSLPTDDFKNITFTINSYPGVLFRTILGVILKDGRVIHASAGIQNLVNQLNFENSIRLSIKNLKIKHLELLKKIPCLKSNEEAGPSHSSIQLQYVIEENLPLQSSENALQMWNENEEQIIPLFVELALLLAAIPFNFNGPENCQLIQQDNGSYKMHLINLFPINLNDFPTLETISMSTSNELIIHQMLILFDFLQTELCMQSIINALIIQHQHNPLVDISLLEEMLITSKNNRLDDLDNCFSFFDDL
ncbi:hypothetical protein CLAVI_000396 [Candidatus Clavichlamydia salmonicola]|uniref:hypothetical protein n=1 Tax=Candidatus Clavichlamydia salmonicola TaxID=469812 RepID=UPI0018910FD8|nr:hypothetical protein [Candidatus Clavichlamydia salmonicola]MBF5050777.1 hypothetical protein [Candidatus Clavichlamydia salmonicola]